MTAAFNTGGEAITGSALGYPDGSSLGSATTDKISFYGVTPVVQPSGSAQAAVTLTAVATAGFGFTTSAQGNNLLALVNAMRSALVATGIMKGSA